MPVVIIIKEIPRVVVVEIQLSKDSHSCYERRVDTHTNNYHRDHYL